MGKVTLYYHTIKNMKFSQVFNRFRIKIGKGCSLGVMPSRRTLDVKKVESPETLDFDPVFLARFPIDKLMGDIITILHSSKKINWKTTWSFKDKSALWNYNLHYFEYLFPLVRAWQDTGNSKYRDKTVEMIEGWIDGNPIGTNPAWASYTTALRIVTWISWYWYASDGLDMYFRQKFLASLHDQFSYLSTHMEKDILGNHYFEDLKSLVLASLFFNDDAVLEKSLNDFRSECKEEILSDGMHFELSPMYHKIILEGMLRVATALRSAGKQDAVIEAYLQPMLDVAYSFENGLERIPLFNDCGNNIAKSLDALEKTAWSVFNMKPQFKWKLEDSGYYIFVKTIDTKIWKLIVDAGQPGPKYIPGHAHCDAMSFELFCDGKPIVVNCGTYAYQCKERGFFRSTSAHNTVMADGIEQSQCWGEFRLARRSNTRVLDITQNSITMEMTDQKGKKVKRIITFSDVLTITDSTSDSCSITSFLHILGNHKAVIHNADITEQGGFYAEDYGQKNYIKTLCLTAENKIDIVLNLKGLLSNIGA